MNSEDQYTFLVVDDEPDIQEIYSIFLGTLLGHEFKFKFFLNGQSCLDYLASLEAKDHKCLIISDINMPVMDGFTLLKNVSNLYSKAEVVLSSAYNSSYYIDKGFELGAVDFIPKPVDFERIASMIRDRLIC